MKSGDKIDSAQAERHRLNTDVLAITGIVWTLSMLWIAIASGQQHDYVSYMAQWKLVLSGANPWSTDNAYGPLHNALAFLMAFGPLGPKMFIVSAFLIANICLVHRLYQTGGSDSIYGIYLLAVPANFLVISMAVTYGLNDALVGALVIFAILARHRGYAVMSGGLLGLAIVLKYYPIVLVPAFAFGLGKQRIRLIASAAIVCLIGIGIAAAFWGLGFLAALTYASAREPKLLSLLAALNSYPNLFGRDVVTALIETNSVFVAAAAAFALFAAWKAKISWLETSVICLLVTLTTYKAGQQQFFLPWLALVAALPLLDTRSATRLSWVCLPFVLFLSVYQWGYAYGSDNYHETLGIVRRAGGFAAFAVAAITIAGCYWPYFGRRAQSVT